MFTVKDKQELWGKLKGMAVVVIMCGMILGYMVVLAGM